MKILEIILMFILFPVDIVITLINAVRIERLRSRVEVLKDMCISQLKEELAEAKHICLYYKQKLDQRKEG